MRRWEEGGWEEEDVEEGGDGDDDDEDDDGGGGAGGPDDDDINQSIKKAFAELSLQEPVEDLSNIYVGALWVNLGASGLVLWAL